MPNRQETMLDVDNWEVFSKKITLGYYNLEGKWVPGTLEQMRDMTTEMATNNAKLEQFISRDRIVDRWTLRAILLIALVRMLGFNNFENLLHTFHLAGQ